MKRTLQILFILGILIFISSNLRSNQKIVQPLKLVKSNIVNTDSVYKFYKDKLNVYKYEIREKLPLLIISDFDSTQVTKNDKIDITVVLPPRIRYADIYLFINSEKIDMYYAVSAGKYTFRNVRLRTGENKIELFYTLGNIRSNSTFFIINKN